MNLTILTLTFSILFGAITLQAQSLGKTTAPEIDEKVSALNPTAFMAE